MSKKEVFKLPSKMTKITGIAPSSSFREKEEAIATVTCEDGSKWDYFFDQKIYRLHGEEEDNG